MCYYVIICVTLVALFSYPTGVDGVPLKVETSRAARYCFLQEISIRLLNSASQWKTAGCNLTYTPDKEWWITVGANPRKVVHTNCTVGCLETSDCNQNSKILMF